MQVYAATDTPRVSTRKEKHVQTIDIAPRDLSSSTPTTTTTTTTALTQSHTSSKAYIHVVAMVQLEATRTFQLGCHTILIPVQGSSRKDIPDRRNTVCKLPGCRRVGLSSVALHRN